MEDFKQYFVTPLYTASVPALEVHRKHQTVPSLQLGKQSRDIPFEAQSGTLLPTRIPPGRRLVDSQGWESVPFPRVLPLAPRKKTARCCSKVVTALDPYIYNYYCLLKVSSEGKIKYKKETPESAAQYRQSCSSRWCPEKKNLSS